MEKMYLAVNIDGNAATAMVAQKDSDGIITPIATEQQALDIKETRNGMISLDGDVQMAISKLQKTILNKLEGGTHEIQGLYIGAMPRSLHGEPIEVRKEFDGKHRITSRDLDNLGKEMQKKIINKIVQICDNGYIRDNVECKKVQDEIADALVLKSLAVVVTPRNYVDYAELMNKDTKLMGFIPTHLAIAKLVTDEDQRMNGVIAMHIGRETTGMTYYFNDMVMATVVVPFGFDHVIHDMSLGEVKEEMLEIYLASDKMRYDWGDDLDKTAKFGKADSSASYHIVQAMKAFAARLREIFILGHDRMVATLNTEKLSVPVVLTTAVINSDEFCEVMSAIIEREVIRGDVGCKLSSDKYENPKFIPLISLINEATENCVTEKELKVVETPPVTIDDDVKVEEEGEEEEGNKKKPRKHPTQWFRGLFDNDDH